MNGSYIYDLNESPEHDTSTASYEYHNFFPTQNSDLNNFSTLRFAIDAKNQCYHIHESYLEAKGQLLQKTGGGEFDDDKAGIAFTHNPFPFMFRNFVYKINGTIVDTVNYPGHVSSLFHNVMFSSNKPYENGLQFFWYPDRSRTATPDNKGWEIRRKMSIVEPEKRGSFTIRIPLSMIFGFAEYTKIITQVQHEIEMTRQEDYFSLFRGDALPAEQSLIKSGGGGKRRKLNDLNASANVDTPEGKIHLQSLILWIPVVKPEGNAKILLKESQLHAKNEYVIAFRQRTGIMTEVPSGLTNWSWSLSTINFKERPKYLFIGFQNNLGSDQKSNYALFDNMDVRRMHAVVNNQQFPAVIADADFKNLDYGNFFTAVQNVRSNFLQLDPLINECGIDPLRYKNLCTIYAFDLTKHERDIVGTTVISRLEVQFKTQTPAHIKAYACLISEKEIFLQSDGGNMTIR